MRPSFRSCLSGVISAALALAACARQPTPLAPTPTVDARSAAVNEIVRVVEARAVEGGTFAQVDVGYVLTAGGQVHTGRDSRARLDLSDGTILRLGQDTSFVLQEITPSAAGGGLLARIKLEAGKIWVSLSGGTLQVETPVGVASVRGSFAVLQYDPGDPADPDDDLLVLDCLEGSCGAKNENVDAQLGNLERVALNRIGQLRLTLTGADVQAFLMENPEGQSIAATLTAAPPATGTPTAVPTGTTPPSPTPSPTDTATQPPTPTPTASATPTSPRPAPALPAAPAADVIGRHVVQNGETLFCIGRGYGVLPAAIARANGLPASVNVVPGQTLQIPAAQWENIPPGPACTPQFTSPFPGFIPTATPTPIPLVTPTPACAPPEFFDPFQQRCRLSDTPGAPAGDTPTPVLPPTELPTPVLPPTEPPSPTDTPIPDTIGPSIDKLDADPKIVASFTTCTVTFTADISDPSGVASAEVQWTSYQNSSQGPPTVIASGSEPMTFRSVSGLTYLVRFGVTVVFDGYLDWKVVAFDTAKNVSESSPGPIIQTRDSSCGV